MIVMTKLTLDRFPHRQITNGNASSCPLDISLSPVNYIFPSCCLRTALFWLVLHFIEFVLPAIDPHQEYGSEHCNDDREDRVHEVNSALE